MIAEIAAFALLLTTESAKQILLDGLKGASFLGRGRMSIVASYAMWEYLCSVYFKEEIFL
jgi:hypothetical protein